MKTELTKPQSKFLKLQCKFPLFVGGYGSGKTFALEVCATRDLLAFPGADIAIYCPTYDLLKLNIIPRLEAMLNSLKLFHVYNKGDYIITVMGYGSFIFRSMDNPDRVVAYEVFRSHCDEIDLLRIDKAEEVWNRIIARNRQKVVDIAWKRADLRAKKGAKGLKEYLSKNGEHAGYIEKGKKIAKYAENKVSAYTTPESFGFTYNRWKKNPGKQYKYVVAPTYSNPHLQEDFIEALADTYTEQMMKAYVEGLWVPLGKGSVYPYFNRTEHCTKRKIKKGEPLHIGIDFNVGKMSGIVFVKEAKSIIHTNLPDVLEVVDELIGYADTPALIAAIEERYKGHTIYVYPDAAGQAHHTVGATVSDHKLLKKAGFKVKALKSNPLVKERVMSVNKLFELGILRINIETCPELVASLEQQAYDKNGEPDKKMDLDHPVDALGYRICYNWLMSKPVTGNYEVVESESENEQYDGSLAA